MRSPLLYISLAFALGIFLQEGVCPSLFLLLLLGTLAAGGLFWIRGRPNVANPTLLLLTALLGAFLGKVDGTSLPNDIARLSSAVPRPVTLEGVLVSDLEGGISPRNARSGWLEVRAFRTKDRWIPASGQLRVKFPAWGEPFHYGDRLRLSGLLRAGERRERFDETRWFWLHGAGGVLTVSSPEGMTRLRKGSGLFPRYRRWVAGRRSHLKRLSRSLMEPEEAAFLTALLLGDRRGIPRQLKETFRKTGTIHVLVVSGLHVGLIGFLCATLLSLLRVPRAGRYFLLTIILIAYCTMTGSRLPVLRATVMGVLLCWSLWRGREFSPLNAFGAAALLILAFHPRALFDVGFQLSFCAVFGILTLTPLFLKITAPRPDLPPVEERGKGRGQKIRRWFVQAMAVSCAAWVAVAPVLAWHFRTVTPVAPIANLVVVPWASFLVVTGFLVMAVGTVLPAAALPFAASFSWAAHGLIQFVSWMAGLPGVSWAW